MNLNSSIFERGLPCDAVGLLVYMLSKPKGWKFSMKELQEQWDIGRTKLRRLLKILQDKGFLVRKMLHDKNGRIVWDWQVYDEPQEIEPTTDGKPTYGKPAIGKSTTDRKPAYGYSITGASIATVNTADGKPTYGKPKTCIEVTCYPEFAGVLTRDATADAEFTNGYTRGGKVTDGVEIRRYDIGNTRGTKTTDGAVINYINYNSLESLINSRVNLPDLGKINSTEVKDRIPSECKKSCKVNSADAKVKIPSECKESSGDKITKRISGVCVSKPQSSRSFSSESLKNYIFNNARARDGEFNRMLTDDSGLPPWPDTSKVDPMLRDKPSTATDPGLWQDDRTTVEPIVKLIPLSDVVETIPTEGVAKITPVWKAAGFESEPEDIAWWEDPETDEAQENSSSLGNQEETSIPAIEGDSEKAEDESPHAIQRAGEASTTPQSRSLFSVSGMDISSGKDKNSPDKIPRERKRELLPHRALFSALASVCNIDWRLATQVQKGQLNRESSLLLKAGITPDALFEFGEWWDNHSWRSNMRGRYRPPGPCEVRKVWGEFEAWREENAERGDMTVLDLQEERTEVWDLSERRTLVLDLSIGNGKIIKRTESEG